MFRLRGLFGLPPDNLGLGAGRGIREVALVRAVGVHQPDVTDAHVGNLAGVRRPDRIGLAKRRGIGAIELLGAIGIHGVDLGIAIAGGEEQDCAAVGRPGLEVVGGGVVGQADGGGNAGGANRDQVDLIAAITGRGEGEAGAIGRPV